MTPERLQKIRSVLARRQPDLTVLADEVHKGRNIAAILRTCDAVGVDVVHTVEPEAGYRPFRGTALGTQKWVAVELYDRFEQAARTLRDGGFQLVVTAAGPGSADFRTVDYCRPTALVLGAENRGVSRSARQWADYRIAIPMVGMVESFNVSVACAVILSEAQRQRQLAGYYDRQRLPQQVYERRFFQWAHPVVAQFCDERGLAYPAVGNDGEIVEPAHWYRAVRIRSHTGTDRVGL